MIYKSRMANAIVLDIIIFYIGTLLYADYRCGNFIHRTNLQPSQCGAQFWNITIILLWYSSFDWIKLYTSNLPATVRKWLQGSCYGDDHLPRWLSDPRPTTTPQRSWSGVMWYFSLPDLLYVIRESVCAK